jgi:hypothetical protein
VCNPTGDFDFLTKIVPRFFCAAEGGLIRDILKVSGAAFICPPSARHAPECAGYHHTFAFEAILIVSQPFELLFPQIRASTMVRDLALLPPKHRFAPIFMKKPIFWAPKKICLVAVFRRRKDGKMEGGTGSTCLSPLLMFPGGARSAPPGKKLNFGVVQDFFFSNPPLVTQTPP